VTYGDDQSRLKIAGEAAENKDEYHSRSTNAIRVSQCAHRLFLSLSLSLSASRCVAISLRRPSASALFLRNSLLGEPPKALNHARHIFGNSSNNGPLSLSLSCRQVATRKLSVSIARRYKFQPQVPLRTKRRKISCSGGIINNGGTRSIDRFGLRLATFTRHGRVLLVRSVSLKRGYRKYACSDAASVIYPFSVFTFSLRILYVYAVLFLMSLCITSECAAPCVAPMRIDNAITKVPRLHIDIRV